MTIRKVLLDAFGTVFSPRVPVPTQYVSLPSRARLLVSR